MSFTVKEKETLLRIRAVIDQLLARPGRTLARSQYWEEYCDFSPQKKAAIPKFFAVPGNVDILFSTLLSMMKLIVRGESRDLKTLGLWGAFLKKAPGEE